MDSWTQQRQQSQSIQRQYSSASTQSAPTSPSASVFQSSSSLSSISSASSATMRQAPPMLNTQQAGFISVPLPSPSGTQPQSYFGSFVPEVPAANQTQQQQSRERIPQQQPGQGQYLGQRGGSGGAPETAPFLKDFNLVAEAAKRAQVACLTRDLGDIGL